MNEGTKKPNPAILVSVAVKRSLDGLKVHPRESYSEVIEKLIRAHGSKIDPDNFPLDEPLVYEDIPNVASQDTLLEHGIPNPINGFTDYH